MCDQHSTVKKKTIPSRQIQWKINWKNGRKKWLDFLKKRDDFGEKVVSDISHHLSHLKMAFFLNFELSTLIDPQTGPWPTLEPKGGP